MKTLTLNNYQLELLESALWHMEGDFRMAALGIDVKEVDGLDKKTVERVSGEIADEYKHLIKMIAEIKD